MNISGRVVDKTGKPVSGALVIAENFQGVGISSAETGLTGQFSITMPDTQSATQLRISAAGFRETIYQPAAGSLGDLEIEKKSFNYWWLLLSISVFLIPHKR